MSEELKPCPFCGGAPEYKKHYIGQTFLSVKCTRCRSQTGQYLDKEFVTRFWNLKENETNQNNESVNSIEAIEKSGSNALDESASSEDREVVEEAGRELIAEDIQRSKYILSESKRLGKITTEISNQRLEFLIVIAERNLEVRTCGGCDHWESHDGSCHLPHNGPMYSKKDFGCIHWKKKQE